MFAKDIRDIANPGVYEREYENWKRAVEAQEQRLAEVQSRLVGWINMTAGALDELRSSDQTDEGYLARDDYERVTAMQDLVNRMYDECGDLPGLKEAAAPELKSAPELRQCLAALEHAA